MSHTEPIPWFIWILLIGFYGWFGWMIYLLLASPVRFIDFLASSYRKWGLQITVVDEKRLKQTTRVFGFFMLIFICFHAAVVLSTVLKSR